MKPWQYLLLVLTLLVNGYCTAIISNPQSSLQRKMGISNLSLLPSTLTKAISIEFQSLAADFLFLNTLTFMGEKSLNNEELSSEEYRSVYKALLNTMRLDQEASDPYVLAETTLPWDAGMVHETNALLMEAAKFRINDPRPYFFIWFNYHYFLNDPQTGLQYLKKAAKIHGAPYYYSLLAARMDVYFGQLEASIMFIQEMIKETTDPQAKINFEQRLDAVKKLYFLESKVKIYTERFGKKPKDIKELMVAGIITAIPSDPYGGIFFIRDDGRVYSTSELLSSKNKNK